jgi:hypothetical protein
MSRESVSTNAEEGTTGFYWSKDKAPQPLTTQAGFSACIYRNSLWTPPEQSSHPLSTASGYIQDIKKSQPA